MTDSQSEPSIICHYSPTPEFNSFGVRFGVRKTSGANASLALAKYALGKDGQCLERGPDDWVATLR
jgi:hypothetical protein